MEYILSGLDLIGFHLLAFGTLACAHVQRKERGEKTHLPGRGALLAAAFARRDMPDVDIRALFIQVQRGSSRVMQAFIADGLFIQRAVVRHSKCL